MYKPYTQKQIDKKIKEGHGKGHKSNYKPWIRIQDISSSGRSHRYEGHTTKRQHHLLSDSELSTCQFFDFHPLVTDIREQYPLIPEDVEKIYEELKIKNPKRQGVSQILTTDFLINFKEGKNTKIAIQVKPSEQLDDPKTISRIMIEKKYFEIKKIPWYIVTEKDIPQTVSENIKWIFQTHSRDVNSSLLNHYYQLFSKEFKANPNKKITLITQSLDLSCKQEIGFSLSLLRTLFSLRYFTFNLNKKFNLLISSDIKLNDSGERK